MFEVVTTSKMLDDAYEIRKAVFVREQGVPLENEIDQFESSATHVIGYDELHSLLQLEGLDPIKMEQN